MVLVSWIELVCRQHRRPFEPDARLLLPAACPQRATMRRCKRANLTWRISRRRSFGRDMNSFGGSTFASFCAPIRSRRELLRNARLRVTGPLVKRLDKPGQILQHFVCLAPLQRDRSRRVGSSATEHPTRCYDGRFGKHPALDDGLGHHRDRSPTSSACRHAKGEGGSQPTACRDSLFDTTRPPRRPRVPSRLSRRGRLRCIAHVGSWIERAHRRTFEGRCLIVEIASPNRITALLGPRRPPLLVVAQHAKCIGLGQ